MVHLGLLLNRIQMNPELDLTSHGGSIPVIYTVYHGLINVQKENLSICILPSLLNLKINLRQEHLVQQFVLILNRLKQVQIPNGTQRLLVVLCMEVYVMRDVLLGQRAAYRKLHRYSP
jgi:hypothetical protein